MSSRFLLRSFVYVLILMLAATQGACAPGGGTGSLTLLGTANLTPAIQGTQVTRSISPGSDAFLTPPPDTPTSRPPAQVTVNPPALTLFTATSLAPQPSPLHSTEASRSVCDKAAPGSPIDVTIIDNTRMNPGQAFAKTWRLLNIGQCKWMADYTAEWFSGDRLGHTQVVALGAEVPPGDTLDITVDMVAPLAAGTYQSNWKLRNASGEWFGIGPDGEQVFWVKIVVIQTRTDTPVPTQTEIPPSLTPTPTVPPTLTPTLTATYTATVTPTITATLTPTTPPAVLAGGPATLVNGDRIDLDTLLLNAGGEDLSFQQDENANHWLVPQEAGVLGVYGTVLPTLQVCVSAYMSSAPIPIESLAPGTYLCFRTGQGFPGWLRYDNFNPQDQILGLDILTWASPAEEP